MTPSTAGPDSPRALDSSPRAPRLAALAGVVALALWRLGAGVPHAMLCNDTCRDLLFARDLFDGRRLHTAGQAASLLGMHHGVLFPDWVALGFAWHRPVVTAHALVLALFLASVAVLFVGARRQLGSHAAWVAAALWIAFGPWGCHLVVLDNFNLMALPLVVFSLSLVVLAREDGALVAAASGVALALGVLAHLAAGVLVPAGLVAAAWSARPGRALAAFAAGLGLTTLVLSTGTVLEDVAVASDHAPLAALLLVATVALGLVTRPPVRRLSPRARARLMLLVALVAAAAGLAATFVLSGQVKSYYAAPSFVPAALLAGELVALVGRSALTAAVVVVATLPGLRLGVFVPPARRLDRLPEVLHRLATMGYGPAALRLRLRSDLRRPLSSCGLALGEPRNAPPPARDLVVVSPAAGASLAQATRPLGATGLRLVEVVPWLDQVHPHLCLTAGPDTRCTALTWQGRASHPEVGFASESLPLARGADAATFDFLYSADHATVSLPLEVRAPGGVRTFVLLANGTSRCAAIERVEGVTARSPLPARRVVVEGVPGARGKLVVAMDLVAGRSGACAFTPEEPMSPPSVAELPGELPLEEAAADPPGEAGSEL